MSDQPTNGETGDWVAFDLEDDADEIEIGYDELLALPMTETVATLMCVSNEIGGNLIGCFGAIVFLEAVRD